MTRHSDPSRRVKNHAVLMDPPLAVLAGARTPWVKAFGPMARLRADELGRLASEAALSRAGLSPQDVDETVFGAVAGPAEASNVARVVALRSGVPNDRPAHTVQRNCASGMEALIAAWHVLRDGRADVVLAGGLESMSNIPLLFQPRLQELLTRLARERTWLGKAKTLAALRPGDLKPVSALLQGLTDPTCGMNMAQTAELLAREFAVSREDQDRFAMESHHKAAAAWETGFFRDEVLTIPAEHAGGGKALDRDVGPRPDQSLAALAKLKPLFGSGDPDQPNTVTAGNSCPLTDGAAALIVSSPDALLDGPPLGYVKAYSVAGCDPRRMGLGPVFAVHQLFEKTGMTWSDFDLVEINEAFAAQVLACLSAFESPQFARDFLHQASPIGALDRDRLNVHGGSIALGHPVGASGARLVLTLLRALEVRGLKRGLATLCVGGGQGCAMWVERP